MVDNSWWIGLITGGTAVVASWVTGRGATRSARVQAEVTAHAAQAAEVRTRRRDAYREMSAAVHGLSEVLWRVEEADAAPDGQPRADVIAEIQTAARAALNEVTRASREVMLEGPTPVAETARTLRRAAIITNSLLGRLVSGSEEQRSQYDAAYRDFRREHLRFLELARGALEVG
ncbi:hypothetical protein [Streptomyces sp. NL15-2K]|uniref:hypothetical protein n=1 Tax=Streptomyces sp. NL15-2K TaxID=376149 RepID=UPI000F56B973|nr:MULTISPECIES: hypothetical protein [Actinomycetes]WKX15947.1 hypothetical protein Q4V64_54095 [Kutzneria buriramensis]GCB52116.1 hypothetical protein SNL152K_9472 [Streptomyces sp. NL15-2K]